MASLSRLQIFQEPMCLITTSDNGKLQIEQEPLKQIKQIDASLVVVAIAGLYRTGKSYLLNRLAGSSSGFPLGKTIESKSKGIWVWCREHPKKANTVLLLLDTEGLGDVAKGDSGHDNRIFTIAALLSNVLVYNMMSAFNQDAVEKLTFITEMSKNIRFSNTKEDVDDEELGLILPTFVLCLRDFSLVLEKDGLEITPDEYLEDCLQLKCGDDSSIKKYNRPRECIRKYFPKRKCFVFDRPGDRKTMQKLESVPFEKLSESFVEETELFLRYMYTCGPKVLISSKPVNGRMFASLMENYINAIRNGAVPDVDDAIMVVANIENERMASEAVQIFKGKIETIQLPILHTNNFEELYRDVQKAALAKFRIESMFNAEKFEKQAVSEMDKLWEKIKSKNLELVREHCENLLLALYNKTIGEKMRRGEYKKAGGYPLYKLDAESVKKEYMVNMKGIDGYEAQQALISFMDKETEIESCIMLEDQKMTEADRQRELDRIHKEHQVAQESQEKLFESKLNEEKERAEVHKIQMEEERREYLNRQEVKMKAIKDEWDAQRQLSEKQMDMMRAENDEQKKSFEDQVNKLADEHKRKEKENKDWFDNMIRRENNMAQQRINDVTSKFQSMLEVEKQKSSNMEKNIQSQKKELEEEQVRRREMQQEYESKMNEYAGRISDLKQRADAKDAKMNEELERLERERNEYRNRASRRRGELERMHTENKQAQEKQQELFECKLQEEKERAEEHQQKMEAERKEYMKQQEQKLADIQCQWDQQRKISEAEVEMMREENETLKKEFQEKINKMADEHKKTEEENKKRFDEMLKKENEKAEKRIAEVRDHFQAMLAVEAEKNAKMEKNLQLQMKQMEAEKKKRKKMEDDHKKALDGYDRKIEDIMKKSKDREDKMDEALKQMREERDEYRREAESSSGLSLGDVLGIVLPPVGIAVKAIEEIDKAAKKKK